MRRCRALAVVPAVGLISLCSPALAALGDNSVGMNVHDGRQTFIDACADLGVGWVRVDGNWWVMEPSQGNYQWGPMDEAISRANAAGLQVFMTLAYTPGWVPRHGDTDGFSGNDVPNGSSEWTSFVAAAVSHYRAMGVRHFGIWNEPNLQGFWEGSLDEYVTTILLPGAAAVRSTCNDCFVLGPDLANVGDCDVYLEGVLAAIPVDTFDIFTHHIYQGFPETGVEIWDGDRYFEVLDDQRFPFTRKDIRQILDAAGYQGEVWITETGERATPIGDDAAEQDQATHITLALDEQLKRGWVTNTFFYEIHDCGPDQPECTIDGFGVMRATGGTAGSRTFPDDFRLKPGYLALKQYIEDHPELAGEAPSQCGDGQDNDGDGFADADDRGCADSADDDESDDPPRERLVAYPAGSVVVDGDLGDVGAEGWLDLNEAHWAGTEPLSGGGDLGVRAAARWDAQGLVLAFEVTDDTQDNDHADAELWMGDSVQVAFDVGQSLGTGYDDTDDHELAFALSGGQPRGYRHHGPSGADDAFELAVVRDGTATRYEVRLPPSVLPSLVLSEGVVLGFTFLVNDADGQGRSGWIEWTPGVGSSKVPYYFGEILLSDGTTPPDGGTGGAAGSGGSPGTGGSAGVGGSAGSSGAAGVAGSPSTSSGGASDEDDDGCGCSVPGGRGGAFGWVVGVALGLVGLSRRGRCL